MALPELIYAPIDGGTIHKYEISGGKRKFLRFIGCYLGNAISTKILMMLMIT